MLGHRGPAYGLSRGSLIKGPAFLRVFLTWCVDVSLRETWLYWIKSAEPAASLFVPLKSKT